MTPQVTSRAKMGILHTLSSLKMKVEFDGLFTYYIHVPVVCKFIFFYLWHIIVHVLQRAVQYYYAYFNAELLGGSMYICSCPVHGGGDFELAGLKQSCMTGTAAHWFPVYSTTHVECFSWGR